MTKFDAIILFFPKLVYAVIVVSLYFGITICLYPFVTPVALFYAWKINRRTHDHSGRELVSMAILWPKIPWDLFEAMGGDTFWGGLRDFVTSRQARGR